jgi:hypothetical protein
MLTFVFLLGFLTALAIIAGAVKAYRILHRL